MTSETKPTGSTILFVGLGAMGNPMVRQLARAGHRLVLHDADGERAKAIADELGAVAVGSLSALAVTPEFAILMLPDSPTVESVVVGAGPDGLLAVLTSETLLIDMGSSEPARTVALAVRAAEQGIELVDAPVSGGISKAVTGELSIMFGGPSATLDRCREVLGALGTSIVNTGPVGSGHAMKALNNMLAAVGLVAGAEVLCVGARFGLTPEVMLEVLNASTGRNQATEVKFPRHVLGRSFDSGFSLRLMVKDLATALGLAHGLGASTPVAAACFEACVGAQHLLDDPGADHTEVVRYVERAIGVELRAT